MKGGGVSIITPGCRTAGFRNLSQQGAQGWLSRLSWDSWFQLQSCSQGSIELWEGSRLSKESA